MDFFGRCATARSREEIWRWRRRPSCRCDEVVPRSLEGFPFRRGRHSDKPIASRSWTDGDVFDIKLILEPQHFPRLSEFHPGMVVAAQSMGGDALALATAFGHALWVDDQDFSQRDVQLRVAESLGFDGAQLIDAATSTETVEALDGCTQSAIEAQVFGMPTYVFRGELLGARPARFSRTCHSSRGVTSIT